MSIKVEYDENQGHWTKSPDENLEDNHVFIKEPKLEPKIEFDAKNPSTDHDVIVMDPLDVENDHKEDEKVFACEKCEKNSFSKNYHLQLHIRNVHEGKNKEHHSCICDKSFSDAGSLKRHIQSFHEGQKDHKCESCGKLFSRADQLKRHIHTVHEGHKDHKCESCGKSFSQAGQLKKHIHNKHEGHDKQ